MLVRFLAAALIGWALAELALYVALCHHKSEPVEIFPCVVRGLPFLTGVVMLFKARALAEWNFGQARPVEKLSWVCPAIFPSSCTHICRLCGIRNTKKFLEESWLFEAVTRNLPAAHPDHPRLGGATSCPARFTLSLSPTLCSMLLDPLLGERYAKTSRRPD